MGRGHHATRQPIVLYVPCCLLGRAGPARTPFEGTLSAENYRAGSVSRCFAHAGLAFEAGMCRFGLPRYIKITHEVSALPVPSMQTDTPTSGEVAVPSGRSIHTAA